MRLRLLSGSKKIDIQIREAGNDIILSCGGEEFITQDNIIASPVSEVLLTPKNAPPIKGIRFGWWRQDNRYHLVLDGQLYEVEVHDRFAVSETDVPGLKDIKRETQVCAPIPGMIVAVKVKSGERVQKDQPIAVLDAMKLENEIPSPREGLVKDVRVRPGEVVEKNQVLVVIQ
jgi:biotin carboxyl carrier protein